MEIKERIQLLLSEMNRGVYEKEAEIVALAGQKDAVTIATNMAGRGTDIMLGGNSEYLAKQEMRKNKIPENLIEESNTYYETDDQEILRAREKFNELEKKYDEEIKEEKENYCKMEEEKRHIRLSSYVVNFF